MFHSLEKRVFLSASVINNILTVTGSSSADVIDITISKNKARVSIAPEGFVKFYSFSDFGGISINAAAGDDYVRIVSTIATPAVISGGNGNDSILSGSGADSISGGPGNDTVRGGRGDDTLDGAAGADALFGDAGRDVISYARRTLGVSVTLDGVNNDGETNEADNIDLSAERFETGAGNDYLNTTGTGADVDVLTHDGNDTVITGNGNDTITTNAGDDLLDGGFGADFFYGDEGIDTITYAARAKPVNLSLDGIDNDGELAEGDMVGSTLDILIGGSKNDVISADLQTEGRALYGNGGNDTLIGSAGDDRINGGAGDDELKGLGGDDFLIGSAGADRMYGGKGLDSVSYSSLNVAVNISADDKSNDGAKNERDNVRSDCEVLIGGNGNDTLTASTNPKIINQLLGGPGNDILNARNSKLDILDGGAGLNTLNSDQTDQVPVA